VSVTVTKSVIYTYVPSSAVWRAIRGTGEDVREPTGETERLPPSVPRFMIYVWLSTRLQDGGAGILTHVMSCLRVNCLYRDADV
jgi:hypothetical protein